MRADLHLHTLKSDGSLTPRAVISSAKALRILTVSVTDHDSVGGIDEAVAAGKEKGVTVIPGIEMSSFRDGEIHILGYNILYNNQSFLSELKRIQQIREKRNLEIIGRLKEHGVNLDYEAIKRNQSGSIGRIHMALAMRDKGYVNSISEAFDRYLGFGCPCYRRTPLIKPEEAIEIISAHGGVPVLAHPYRYVEEGKIYELIMSLEGLKGLEVYYPLHTDSIKEILYDIAKEKNLIVTGGSDFHNLQSGNPIGSGNYEMDEYAASLLLG
ncbi:MAG: PHP domain-containing protein [Christensenellales bacterium]|jgi:predicted metal-dependent phosphoesterase TrpH